MGLIDSVNNINYTLREKKETETKKELERKAKEKERQKAKEEKEAKERIKNEINIFLYNYFKEFLIKNGSNNIYYLYNSNLKDSILQQILNNYTIAKTFKLKNGNTYNSNYVQYKDFITQFYNNNYFKILKKAEEEAKRNEEYEIYAQLTTPKKEEYQQETPVQPIKKEKHIDFNKINKVINIIFTIILIVLFFPIAILIAACKNQK